MDFKKLRNGFRLSGPNVAIIEGKKREGKKEEKKKVGKKEIRKERHKWERC